MDSDGATSPDSVNLLGSGVEPPAPVPNRTSLDFGDVPVGTTSARQFVFVTNASPISSLPLGQPSASGDFAVPSSNCSGTTLPPVSTSRLVLRRLRHLQPHHDRPGHRHPHHPRRQRLPLGKRGAVG